MKSRVVLSQRWTLAEMYFRRDVFRNLLVVLKLAFYYRKDLQEKYFRRDELSRRCTFAEKRNATSLVVVNLDFYYRRAEIQREVLSQKELPGEVLSQRCTFAEICYAISWSLLISHSTIAELNEITSKLLINTSNTSLWSCIKLMHHETNVSPMHVI